MRGNTIFECDFKLDLDLTETPRGGYMALEDNPKGRMEFTIDFGNHLSNWACHNKDLYTFIVSYDDKSKRLHLSAVSFLDSLSVIYDTELTQYPMTFLDYIKHDINVILSDTRVGDEPVGHITFADGSEFDLFVGDIISPEPLTPDGSTFIVSNIPLGSSAAEYNSLLVKKSQVISEIQETVNNYGKKWMEEKFEKQYGWVKGKTKLRQGNTSFTYTGISLVPRVSSGGAKSGEPSYVPYIHEVIPLSNFLGSSWENITDKRDDENRKRGKNITVG